MKRNLLFNQTTAIGKRLAMVLTMLVIVGIGSAWGAEELVYTLDGTITGGSNGYATNSELTINELDWVITGNTTISPWRIGGKSLSKIDRAVYSKTAMPYNISKIEITHGTASGITVNSFKLIISDAANDSGTEIPVTFKASATTTIELPAGDYTNKYFKFLYNVTVSVSDNKYLQFTNAKFYAETAPAVTYEVTWKVDGETYTEGSPSTSVSGGSKVTQLPTNPDDCSADVVFVGWTELTTFNGTKPSDLFSDVEGSPVIDNRTTFYAVFAKREGEQKETTSTATISGSTSGSVKDVLSWSSEQQTSANAPTWNTNNSEYRFYYHSGGNGCSMTIDAEEGVTITGIKITASSTSYRTTVKYNVDGGSDQTGSWSSTTMTITELSAESFKFRNANTTNTQLRFKNVVVTYSMLSGEYTYTDYTTSCNTEPTGYTITYNTNGGDVIAATSGTALPNPLPTPTREHYTFVGWYTDERCTQDATADATIDADITLYAKWTAKTYTITFNAGTGECDTESVTTTNADGVVLPTASPSNACTEEGWTFAGWATASVNETTTAPTTSYAAGSNYKPTGDIPLYAVYMKQTFTLSTVYNSTTYYVGGYESSKAILTAETEKNNAMIFRIVDEQYLHCEDGYISHNSTSNTNVSCYADKNNVFPWTITENTGTISFQSTKAEGNVRYLGYNYNDGNPRFAVYVDSYAHNFTKTTTTTYNSDPECTPPCAMVTITNATPSIGGFSLSINTEAVTSPIENCGQGNLTITIVPYAGYLIESVSNATDVSIDSYGTATVTYPKNTTIDSEVTLVARAYTITLHTNGGTINSGNVSSYKCGEGAILPTDVTKNGYTFGGWYEFDTFYGPAVTTIGTAETGDKEFYAKWTANKYDITYKDQGNAAFSGTHETGYPTQHTYGTETTLKGATKTGYTFEGWYKDATCTNKVTTLGAAEYTGTITLYAKWTANKYDITYKDQGDAAFSGTHEIGYPTQHTYGTGTTLKGATKTGYTFEGWYKDATCTNKVTTLGAAEYTNSITLYAKWLEIFTITWMVNGEVYTTTEVVEGEPITPPASPDAGDYCGQVFAGWTNAEMVETTNVDPTLYPTPTPFPVASSNITYYAVFADYAQQ